MVVRTGKLCDDQCCRVIVKFIQVKQIEKSMLDKF